MKKLILAALTAVIVAMPVTAFAAAPKWHIDKTVTVEEGSKLNYETAPELVISKSDNFRQDFDFEIVIDNAQWLYGDSGTIEKGIDYIKFGDESLYVFVDVDEFDATKKDIRIPLYCVVDGDASATLICTDYHINPEADTSFAGLPLDDTTTVKYNGDARIYGENDKLGAIIIEEWKTKSFKAGEGYYLNLMNEFEFTEIGKITFGGDFAEDDGVEYYLNKYNPGRAEIIFSKDMERPTGKITITGAEVASTAKSGFKGTDIVLTRDGFEDFAVVIDIGTYTQSIPADSPVKVTDIDMDKEAITIRGTGAPSKKIKVFVGGADMGETRVDTKGKWELSAKFENKLEVGTYLVETGYYSQSAGKFSSVVKTEVEIADAQKVSFTLGKDSYVKGGKTYAIDGGLFIDANNRMMVPLRALANALDIKDENIGWDDSTKCVTLKDGKVVVKVYIGSNVLKVNDKEVKIDTEAVIKGGRTYLPLRGICEVLSAGVEWAAVIKTAVISK